MRKSAALPMAISPVMAPRPAADAPPVVAASSHVHPPPHEKSPAAMPKAMRWLASAASMRRKPSLRVPSVPNPIRMPIVAMRAACAMALPFHWLATGL